MKYINKFPTPLLFFITLWAWAWGWWGDVLWTAHERSFFAFEPELVQHIWSKPYGSLWLIGRAILSLCAYPWLGALIFAVMLTGIACCLRYIVARHGTSYISHKRLIIDTLCYVPSLLWVLQLTCASFNAYFKAEPGRIFGIPALWLIIVALQAFLLWTFRRRRKAVQQQPTHPLKWAYALIPVLFIVLTTQFERYCRPWTRPTAQMERLYADEDWTGIREVALDNDRVTCRPMAAYYAIALVRQNAIMKNLFDIRFEYDSIHMYDYNGVLMNNTPYYVTECDLHAGLLQFAYHKAIEDMTVDGVTIHNLKLMTQITAMRHENKVCRKYLDILDRTIGTSDFTSRWRTYLADSLKMEADATVKSIRNLEPVHDGFESGYTDPAFLGYNLQLYEGRSQEALINSIAVCLYTKLVPPFLERAQYLTPDGIMQNQIIADALAMQIAKNPDILKALPQLKMNQSRYQMFVQQLKNIGAVGGTEQRMPFADPLYETGRCYYPYYYFFGNLGATRKDAAARYGYGQKDGVN